MEVKGIKLGELKRAHADAEKRRSWAIAYAARMKRRTLEDRGSLPAIHKSLAKIEEIRRDVRGRRTRHRRLWMMRMRSWSLSARNKIAVIRDGPAPAQSAAINERWEVPEAAEVRRQGDLELRLIGQLEELQEGLNKARERYQFIAGRVDQLPGKFEKIPRFRRRRRLWQSERRAWLRKSCYRTISRPGSSKVRVEAANAAAR